jgi:hypothetical protein
MAQRDPYFDNMAERQVVVWAFAVRRQLERWEPHVAKYTLMGLQRQQKPPPDDPVTMNTHEYWEGETEHHLLLIACRNLLVALELLDQPPSLDPIVAAELKESRDLNEHWTENMPVFQVGPERPGQPKYPSGKKFAKRNPRHGPYCWWAWDGNLGPRVTPNVPATQVHELVEISIAAASATKPEFGDGIAPPAARPWIIPMAPGEWWWPRLD